MAFNPLAGKAGAVNVGATAYAFGHWRASIKNTPGKVTNFTGGGYRQLVTGITEATITVDGPYDQGNMAFTIGSTYILILQYTPAVTLTVTTILTGLEPDIDVEKEERVTLTFDQTGSFTAAIT